jgi:phytoene synthase
MRFVVSLMIWWMRVNLPKRHWLNSSSDSMLFNGHPQPHLEDNALALVVDQYQLPRAMLEALIEGFEWDAHGKTYETIEAVHQYGARVAGSVGAMMCWIMGPRHATALARACELGVAMQLTNIARDVGEDARNGRLYLPHVWMREAGIDPDAWLAAPVFLLLFNRSLNVCWSRLNVCI